MRRFDGAADGQTAACRQPRYGFYMLLLCYAWILNEMDLCGKTKNAAFPHIVGIAGLFCVFRASGQSLLHLHVSRLFAAAVYYKTQAPCPGSKSAVPFPRGKEKSLPSAKSGRRAAEEQDKAAEGSGGKCRR